MSYRRSTVFWRGQALHNLPRSGLEAAAAQAIEELMKVAEQEKSKAQQELLAFVFVAGAMVAALGAGFGLLLR